ncbi:MAG: MFS transporter [Pseudomonadota bacterium]
MTAPQDAHQQAPRRATQWFADPMLHAVVGLGITQIISWGTCLYGLGVLADPISAETGWSRSLIFSGLTVALLASSVVSPWTGRMIDRHGARAVMAAGSLLSAVGLLILAFAANPTVYIFAWLILGPAMRMTLYDAAFAALVQVTPTRGRRAISYLTLFGGFASTIFWPIGHELALSIGWRETLIVYACLHALVCLPLHWWSLARREQAPTSPSAVPVPQDTETATPENARVPAAPTAMTDTQQHEAPLEGRARFTAMALFALVVSANGFVFGAMSVHLVSVIGAAGVPLALAVNIAAMKGVAQVAGRVGDIVFGRNIDPLTVGRLAIALLPVGLIVLLLADGAVALIITFTLLLGVSNGLVTIMRGAVPLKLFGPRGYGEVLGILATPYWLMNALAPATFAFVVDGLGATAGVLLLLVAAIVAMLAMECLTFWLARRPSQAVAR